MKKENENEKRIARTIYIFVFNQNILLNILLIK